MRSGSVVTSAKKSTQGRFFDISKPGEYGQGHKPSGFILVMHAKLGKQRIFISSLDFREAIAVHYRIPPTNIVSLIEAQAGSPDGIPEECLDAAKGLALFQQRLAKINNTHDDVVIHCKKGQNRSPVAAVIYLINRGLTANEAVAAVTNAYQAQRNRKFELNSRGHYTAVLQEAYCLQENSSIHDNTETKRRKCDYALRNLSKK